MSVLDEEQYLSGSIMLNGQHVPATSTNVRSAQPAGSTTYAFTAPFSMLLNGQHLTYRKGQTIHVSASLLAALNARSAPIVLVP